jgi:hypothetical protein|tara:strand:+ start:3641 stop:4066 length:426 start_codon:yes stop_codon:yes gene_type:complete
MKKTQIGMLKKIIQETVEKEVAKQIGIVIQEITSPTQSNGVSAKPIVDKEYKQLVKDPVLNEILNETQGGLPGSEPAQDAWPTMGGGPVSTVGQFEGLQAQMQPQQPVNTAGMPDFLKKAFSGHDAKVVQAINKKHGTRTK